MKKRLKKKNARKCAQQLLNAQQRAQQQGQKNGQSKRVKGSKEQQGQCPQGSKKEISLDKAQKQKESLNRKKKKIREIEKIKKNKRSLLETLHLNFLKFDMDNRYSEILYYLLFALLVPLFVIYSNALFIVLYSLIIKIAIVKSLDFIACLIVSLGGFAASLILELGIQHLLVESSRKNKKKIKNVNKMLLAIIATCFIVFPTLLDLPVMCVLKPFKEVATQILSVILS